MKITNFLTMNMNGDPIQSDTNGNNIAFDCFYCGYPILASTKENTLGNTKEHPSTCKGCKQDYFLDVSENWRILYIHPIEPFKPHIYETH